MTGYRSGRFTARRKRGPARHIRGLARHGAPSTAMPVVYGLAAGAAADGNGCDTERDCAHLVPPALGHSGPGHLGPAAHERPLPRRGTLPQNEDHIHRAVVLHLRARAHPDVVWWHTPNDGKRSPTVASRLLAMGMLAGVADLLLVRNGRLYALELKSDRGRPTAAQVDFASRMNSAGATAVICRGLDQALWCLKTWGLIQ